MSKIVLKALAAALWLGSAMAAAAAVTLTPPAQQRLGLATSRLTLTRRTAEIDAFAKVLDPGPLVQLASDLATAEAAADASRAEAVRARSLTGAGGGVAAREVEAAVSQARQDSLRVALLRSRLGLEWGPGIARLSPERRARLVAALAAGSAALVHVDTHNNEGQPGAKSVRVDLGDGSVSGRVLGPARQAEPRLQSSGLLVEVDGRQAIQLSIGLTQSAHIRSTSQETGVFLPRAAIIRYRGADWVYVRTGPASFERRLVEAPVPGAEGFFASKGFAAGDEVVVGGAAALFAVEQDQAERGD